LPYRIEYAPEAENHLRALTAWQRATVLDTVDKQLQYQPEVKTKNRKPLRPNLLAPWELRIDSLRVYYSVDESNLLVYIHAIGIKKRNQVWIGKEVIDL
jgi:mRNA-degrading endonuclease RelE of RelBE toxin-antitoxin system